MAKKPNYRWRPAPWMGQPKKGQPTVVVNPPAAPSVVVTESKGIGSTIAVILGLGAVAFGVMELTGVTHVFSSTTPPPPPKPATPAAPPNPVGAAITAAAAALSPGATPATPATK